MYTYGDDDEKNNTQSPGDTSACGREYLKRNVDRIMINGA